MLRNKRTGTKRSPPPQFYQPYDHAAARLVKSNKKIIKKLFLLPFCCESSAGPGRRKRDNFGKCGTYSSGCLPGWEYSQYACIFMSPGPLNVNYNGGDQYCKGLSADAKMVGFEDTSQFIGHWDKMGRSKSI